MSRAPKAMGKAHEPFALFSVETLEGQNDALPRLQPLLDRAGEQLTGTRLDLAFRDPTGEQLAHPTRCERRPALLDDSLGKARRLRRLGSDDDEKAAGRVAQPMRRREHAAPGRHVNRARRAASSAGALR